MVGPLMLPFLEYLSEFCSQNGNIEDLPDEVDISMDAKTGSCERGDPFKELLKLCMKSSDREIRDRARMLWTAEHGNAPVPGVPVRLADFKKWTA